MEDLTPLYVEAGIQDQLLQSYRRYQLLVQCSLLLGGIGFLLFATQAEGSSLLLLTAGWFLLAAFAFWSATKLAALIRSRMADVDYWQRQILEHEAQHPQAQQHLTKFKQHQKLRAGNTAVTVEVNQLLEKEKGHTRQLLDDRLITAFRITWILLGVLLLTRVSIVFFNESLT